MKIKNILPIVGILILVYLLIKIGVGNILSSISDFNFWYSPLVILCICLPLVIGPYKWGLLLRAQKIKIDFYSLFKLNLASIFYSSITPGRVGSFIKIYYFKNHAKKKLGECASSIMIDRFLDLFTVVLFAVFGAIVLVHYFSGVLIPFIILLFAILVGFIFFFNKQRSEWVLKYVYRFLVPKKLKEIARDSFHSFYKNLPRKRDLILPFLVSIVHWFAIYSASYFVFLALGMKINYFIYIFLFSVASLISFLPVTIAGLGTREASLVGIFGLFNISAAQIVAVSLISFAFGIFPVLIGWYVSIAERSFYD